MTHEEMIDEFQCPGCVCGTNTKNCEHVKVEKHGDYAQCTAHVLGTVLMPIGNIALGLPKGFNRPGWEFIPKRTSNQMVIRNWTDGTKPDWDKLNIPVWAMEKDGFLFVRTYMPRVNLTAVDVIEKGTLALCPQAIDVGQFYNEID